MFRREWRQQILVLALLTVAVAAASRRRRLRLHLPADPGRHLRVGASSASPSTPPGPRLGVDIAAARGYFGTVDVHRDPGGLRTGGGPTALDSAPRTRTAPTARRCWPYVQGRYPTGADEVAVTDKVGGGPAK